MQNCFTFSLDTIVVKFDSDDIQNEIQYSESILDPEEHIILTWQRGGETTDVCFVNMFFKLIADTGFKSQPVKPK